MRRVVRDGSASLPLSLPMYLPHSEYLRVRDGVDFTQFRAFDLAAIIYRVVPGEMPYAT